jgi:hypothetical protein
MRESAGWETEVRTKEEGDCKMGDRGREIYGKEGVRRGEWRVR